MLSAEEIGRLFPGASAGDIERLAHLQRLGLAHGMSGRWPGGEFERDAAWQADVGESIAWLERRLDDECVLSLYAGAHAAGLARRALASPGRSAAKAGRLTSGGRSAAGHHDGGFLL